MVRWRVNAVCWIALLVGGGLQLLYQPTAWGEESRGGGKPQVSLPELKEAIERAVTFFRTHVALEGGYVYQVSADGRYREGEGNASNDIVWVQPPATPSVGLAYLDAFRELQEPYLLEAARETAACLLSGQLKSGGWQNYILLAEEDRDRFDYRIDSKVKPKAKNWSSLDDDQTQSVIRFLARLDQTLEFKDAEIHEAVLYALDCLLANQHPNGAWSQGFDTLKPSVVPADLRASYPETWSREHPKADYWEYYTLNDNTQVDVLNTLWFVFDIYGEERFREAALKGTEFLLLAQMPDPQPAWAQQYDVNMHPSWARKFEPPAVSAGESQKVIDYLFTAFERTQVDRYLQSAERALAYLLKLETEDKKLARFYELQTDVPLYFTKAYELTYDGSDVPTHYGFTVSSRLDVLAGKLAAIRKKTPQDGTSRLQAPSAMVARPPNQQRVLSVLQDLTPEGAWVEKGELKAVKAKDHDGKLIVSKTFIDNLNALVRAAKALQD